MGRVSALAIAAVLLAGCGGPAAPSRSASLPSSSTPVPATDASPAGAAQLGVLVQRAGGAEPYAIQLVRPDGHALPAVHALARSLKTYRPTVAPCPIGACPSPAAATATANYQLPETSVSATHVYFLDGEADVKSLSPTGTVAFVRHLELEPNSNVAFAVSPDDRRIAVAVITYPTEASGVPYTLSLSVEDLAGGGNRTEVFTSSSMVAWPVGWRAGNVVLAIGQPGVFTAFNPYAAVEYHLVDPASWTRQALVTCNFGPLVSAGSACWKAGTLGRQDWSGGTQSFRLDPSGPVSRLQPAYLALSPDGERIAGAVRAGAAGSYDTELFEDGSESLLARGAEPLGWLDGSHLLVVAPTGPAIAAVPGGALTPVTGLTRLPGQGLPSLLGVLPASLG